MEEWLRYSVCGGTLWAIPSIHHHPLFAIDTFHLLHSENCPVKAVAVEMPESAVTKAFAWMKTLNPNKAFPRYTFVETVQETIHHSLRGRATALCRAYGRSLEELPPSVLKTYLHTGFSMGYSLNPLDSMTEAMRSAVERNLPCFGVDSPRHASVVRSDLLLPDPMDSTSTADYYHHFSSLLNPDAHQVDKAREQWMTFQVRKLLMQYGDVLLVCGMAHLPRILEQLEKKETLPTPDKNALSEALFEIHTKSKSQGLPGPYPWFCWPYEVARRTKMNYLDLQIYLATSLSRLFQTVEKKYFAPGNKVLAQSLKERDLLKLREWKDFLRNEMKFANEIVPMVSTLYSTAQNMMSPEFATHLAQHLRMERENSSGEIGETRSLLPDIRETSVSGFIHYYEPYAYLTTGMAAQAFQWLRRRRLHAAEALFQGDWGRGLSHRAMIRSAARGKEDIWIRTLSQHSSDCLLEREDGYPIVWILDPEGDPAKLGTLFNKSSWIEPYVSDKAWFQKIRGSKDHEFICSILIESLESERIPVSENEYVIRQKLHGFLNFYPNCLGDPQVATWLQNGGDKRTYIGPTPVDNFLPHFPQISKGLWAEDLIRFAIKHAEQNVTVVAPAHFQIPPSVRALAQQKHINLYTVPLGIFPPDLIAAIHLYITAVAAVDTPYTLYSPEVEKAIGIPQTQWRDKVPNYWLNYGKVL